MHHLSNLTTDRPTFVTHLECGLKGDRYEADRLHGVGVEHGAEGMRPWIEDRSGIYIGRDLSSARQTIERTVANNRRTKKTTK